MKDSKFPTPTATEPSLEEQTRALDSREEMLRTLHLAYRDALDQAMVRCHEAFNEKVPQEERRLTPEEQYDLGRRLALYWDLGRENLPKPAPRDFDASLDELVKELLREWKKQRAKQLGNENEER